MTVMNILSLKEFYNKYQYALVNAFKAAIASLIGYLVGHYLGTVLGVAQMYSWIIITILVVMSSQPNLGGAIDKAIMRFIGTSISATIAILIIYFAGQYQLVILSFSLCLIFIAVLIANAITKYTYAGVLSAVTIAITMLGQHISVSFAFYRAIEVLIGVILALLVNRFIFPIRAEKQIEKSFSQAIKEIKKLHGYLTKRESYESLLAKMFDHFSKQINLIKEIKYEKGKVHVDHYQAINRSIRRLYRYLCVIHDYIEAYPEKREIFTHQADLITLYQTIDQLLNDLSMSFIERKVLDISALQKAKDNLNHFILTNTQPNSKSVSTLAFSLQSMLNMIEAIIHSQKLIYDNKN